MTAAASEIVRVHARQILDSRGRPTVEADVVLADGSQGRACAPSGASTGRYEALELRDGDPTDYAGLSVHRAIAHVKQEIASRAMGLDAMDQEALDQALVNLDKSASLARLGANAVLATSLAAARAAAIHAGEPLYRYIAHLAGQPMSMPMPMTNILSGGAHASRGMDFQDFLVVPVGASSYSEALHVVSRVRASATELMRERGLTVLLADEGGLSPGFPNGAMALELMVQCFEHAKLRPGVDVAIAIDVAASELFHEDHYVLDGEERKFASEEMADYVAALVRHFPVVSIEDPLDQDDWTGWKRVTLALPEVQIVGDDLFATNMARIRQGIDRGVANAALIKLNQNGTLSGTLRAMKTARAAGYATVVSARSGETEDTFIADLAVGSGAGQIKIGSVRSSERLAKYNQLLRIEEEANLAFAGMSSMSPNFLNAGAKAMGADL